MKVENVKKERWNWSVDVDGHTIKVENTTNDVKLLVDDKIQDMYIGFIGSPRLTGHLPNGKAIKASICGNFKIRCLIFVDDELVLES